MKQYKGIYGYWDLKKNEVVYVGKDSKLSKEVRRKDHMRSSKYEDQVINTVLQNNPDRYEYYEICNLPMDATDDELIHYEKLYIAKYDPKFNFTIGGDGTSGYHHTEESKRKIRESNKGLKRSEEARRNMSKGQTGRKQSEETKRKISESMKGMNAGENNPRYGVEVSEEIKQKLREANTKPYARITKSGFKKGKQNYALVYEGKYIKYSIYPDKLKSYAIENNLPLQTPESNKIKKDKVKYFNNYIVEL